MRCGMYHTKDHVQNGAAIGQRMATLCVLWLIRQRVQRQWAGESTGGGGALMLVWCSSNFVSGISVGIALCVLPE